MSHIRVEFDAIPKFDLVDAAAGMSPGGACRGLLGVWLGVVRSKKRTITALVLRGYFPGAKDIAEVLCAFGFLELIGPGEYRIKGADRLLKELRAKSDAGKANVGNLKRGQEPGPGTGREPGPSRDGAGTEPETLPGFAPALTPKHPNTQTPNIKPPPPTPSAPEQQVVVGKTEWTRQELSTSDGWLQFANCRRARWGLAPERKPKGFDEWFTRLIERIRYPERLCAAYDAYLEDRTITASGKPMRVFMLEEIYAHRLAPLEAYA